MTSEVGICNLALAHLRTQSINSLQDPSVQAQYCKLFYPVARDAVLQEHNWNGSHKLATLAVLDNDTYDVFNWVYAYAYPTDCLHINRLVPNYEANASTADGLAWRPEYHQDMINQAVSAANVPYEIFNLDGTKVIASNDKELRVDYRARITDTELFSPQLVLALSYHLATHLAVPIIGADAGRAMRADALNLYQDAINQAKVSNLNEAGAGPQRESEYVTVRG